MTRKKVKLAYIASDSARKATFKKRKKGLIKKVSELSTLCGIDACAIIYRPDDSQPEVWPSPMGVQQVLSQFTELPEMEQSKKMVNQESFLQQRIVKATEQLKKQQKDKREKEIAQVMYQGLIGGSLNNLNMMDLHDLGWTIDQNLKDVYIRIEKLNNAPQMMTASSSSSSSSSVTGTSSAGGDTFVATHQGEKPVRAVPPLEMNNMDAVNREQWFMNLMNPQEQMGLSGEEMMMMMMPLGDNHSNNALWSSAFFN